MLVLASTPRAQAVPHIANCPVFPRGEYYTRAVSHDQVDPHSDQYIRSMIDAGNTAGFWAAARPVEYVNLATARTPKLGVRQKVSYHRFGEAFPWSPEFRIEPLSDAHAIVVDTQRCRLYESYDTTYSDGVLAAYSGAVWDLRESFAPLPPGTPSSMASGLSLFAGMVKWEEVARGSIDHALNWAPPAGTVARWSFIRPASDTDGIPFKGSSVYQLPYGAHLRLKASFDISHFGPQSRAIARAMQIYGIYLADTGSSGNAIYNALPLDGTDRWDAADLAALSTITIDDFEVLRLAPAQRVPGHD
jgi:hypothetical protein